MNLKRNEIASQDDALKREQKRICSWAMTSALVLAVIFILFDEKAIGKGLLLGTLFSMVNFFLLGKSIPLTLGRSRFRAGFMGFGSLLTRFAILAIPLVVAVKSSSFHFAAVVVGIFAVQIVTLVDYLIIRPRFDGR